MNSSGPRLTRAAGVGLATLVVAIVAISLSDAGGSGLTPPGNSPGPIHPTPTRMTSQLPVPASTFPTTSPTASSVPTPDPVDSSLRRQPCHPPSTHHDGSDLHAGSNPNRSPSSDAYEPEMPHGLGHPIRIPPLVHRDALLRGGRK